MKKSQVTIFIIVGIIILFFIAFLVYLSFPDLSRYVGNLRMDDKTSLKVSIENCISGAARDWLYVYGLHTGQYLENGANFGLNYSESIMPDIEETKVELAEFLKDNLPFCIDKYQGFHGFNVSSRNPDFEVIFTDKKAIIKYSDIYYAVNDETAIGSGDGSIEIDQRTKFVLEQATGMIEKRSAEKYIRDDDALKEPLQEIEVIRNDAFLERWLITDNTDPYQPYYFAFLAQVEK